MAGGPLAPRPGPARAAARAGGGALSPARLLRAFTSLKTTAVLLVVLAALLFLNVAVPQATVFGEEGLAAIVGTSPWKRFFLVTLRLSYLSTSPVFVVVLGVFYLNLALVLAQRVGPTLRKLKVRPRSEAGLVAWARTGGALAAPLPAGWDLAVLVETLRGFGYRVERVGERTFWGLKHRTAAVGFLLFHLSFFLIFAGGLLIYVTRFVGVVTLSEGQEFSGEYEQVVRTPPLGGAPSLRFRVEEVTPRLEDGQPVHLGTLFHFPGPEVRQQARINDPAAWGPVKLLANQAGLTAVLWVRDGRGFTHDRVAAAISDRRGSPTLLPVFEGRYLVSIEPQPVDRTFPGREDLPAHPVELTVVRQGDREAGVAAETVFEGSLRPGETADLGGDQLVLRELLYWVRVQVVSERGGALLIAGFVVGIVGLVWRLMLYRREVAVVWDEETLRLVGSSEYFPERFQDELEAIWNTLRGAPGRPRGDEAGTLSGDSHRARGPLG